VGQSVFVESFARVCRTRPDEVLLHAPSAGVAWTSREIRDGAAAIGRTLREAGLTRGDVVACAVGNHPLFVALALACLAEGWPLLAADRGTTTSEAEALADAWHATAIVLDAHAAPTEPHRATNLPGGLQLHVRQPRPDPGRYGQACLLKLTSGSTGTPKVTLTEERHLEADVRHIAACMDIRPNTRQLGVIPLAHSYGFSNLVLPLLWQGSPLVLRPGFVPQQVAEDVARFGVETWAGVPFMFDHVASHHEGALPPALRTCISAGTRLDAATVHAFHVRTGLKIRSFYGSSETGGICFDSSEGLHDPVPVGRPMGDTRVTLVPDAEAPEGSGRVVVGGPAVITGYADGQDADAFDQGWFITSDFGQFTLDGLLVLTGRASAVVNVAGRKVSPIEVEAAIRELPGVREVVVAAIADPRRGQAIGACLVADVPYSAATLRTALAGRLAPYKLPRAVVQVDALPVTPRGKTDREAIAALLAPVAQVAGES
jgi:long-chain acyl-CoA synthetase